jgi:hypothetical protein
MSTPPRRTPNAVKMAKLCELRLAAEAEAAVVTIIIAAGAVGVGEISYRLVQFIN